MSEDNWTNDQYAMITSAALSAVTTAELPVISSAELIGIT
jgi:hypothetical protein